MHLFLQPFILCFVLSLSPSLSSFVASATSSTLFLQIFFVKVVMELILIVTSLCVCLSLLQTTPCASMQIVPEQLWLHDQQTKNEVGHFSLPMVLPRKVRHLQEAMAVKGNGDDEAPASSNKRKRDMSDEPYHNKQNVMQGSKGTWQEWKEGTDTWQFSTMDYSHVKSRRPIHNKFLPVGP